jgi:hypothetical protein
MPSHLPAVADALCADAKRHGFTVHSNAIGEEIPFIGLSRFYASNEESIHICAGSSVDSMSASLALCELLHTGQLPHEINWVITPFINPHGMTANTALNAEGINIKEDYKSLKSQEARLHVELLESLSKKPLNLSIALDEDWEANGSYLFEENINTKAQTSCGRDILEATRPFCPVDINTAINGFSAQKGLIQVDQAPENLPQWTLSDYLKAKELCPNNYRLYIPNERPMNARIQAHKAAILQTSKKLIEAPNALLRLHPSAR